MALQKFKKILLFPTWME